MSAETAFNKKTEKFPEPFKKETEAVMLPAAPAMPAQSGERVANMLVSDLDAHILDRFKAQPKTLSEIDALVVETPKAGRHRLSLPPELEVYTNKYAFCWIFKKKRAIDEACNQYHWVLCNRTYFQDLPNHLFTAWGAIEQGDEILAFRTKEVDEIMRKAPGLESARNIRNRIDAHKGDPTYYVPDPEFEKGPDGKLREIPVVGV